MRRLGWLVGAPLAVFRFLRRKIPIVEIDPASAATPLTNEDRDTAQRERQDGVGPVVHRLFSATIRGPKFTADRVLAIVSADPT
jgi:hypothetical protein